jgi:hypothetical protein
MSTNLATSALPMQRRVIAIFAIDRLDDDPVTRQAFSMIRGGRGAETTPRSSHDGKPVSLAS